MLDEVNDEDKYKAFLKLPTYSTGRQKDLIDGIINYVGAALETSPKERTGPGGMEELRDGEWYAHKNTLGEWKGKITYGCRNIKEIILLHERVHGKSCSVEGISTLVEIETPHFQQNRIDNAIRHPENLDTLLGPFPLGRAWPKEAPG